MGVLVKWGIYERSRAGMKSVRHICVQHPIIFLDLLQRIDRARHLDKSRILLKSAKYSKVG